MLSQKSLVKLVAQHPYHSRDPTHLSFPAQAIITAQPGQDGNALWYGNYGSQSGWFSPSYCRLQPTLRRPAQVRHHVSFSGSRPSPHQYSAPARAHSWNAPMHSLQESPSKEGSGGRDTMTTEDESHSSSAQSEAVDDEQKRKQDLEESLEVDTRTQSSTTPRPIDDTHGHDTSCGEADDAVSCTETTPKRRNRPMQVLQGLARRRTTEAVSPGKLEVARPRLFSSASKLRSFFKERQAVSQIDTMSPPSCIYIECTSPPQPPLPRKPEVREPAGPIEQNVYLEERIHTPMEFSALGPVDPIEVWAAEFRMRQQQQLLLQRQRA